MFLIMGNFSFYKIGFSYQPQGSRDVETVFSAHAQKVRSKLIKNVELTCLIKGEELNFNDRIRLADRRELDQVTTCTSINTQTAIKNSSLILQSL